MATIRAYTTIEQSRKLAEILPLESADTCYKCLGEDPYDIVMRPYTDWKEKYKGLLVNYEVDVIPCWSLSALLGVLPNASILLKGFDKIYDLTNSSGEIARADNPVDACYEMILKLNELKML